MRHYFSIFLLLSAVLAPACVFAKSGPAPFLDDTRVEALLCNDAAISCPEDGDVSEAFRQSFIAKANACVKERFAITENPYASLDNNLMSLPRRFYKKEAEDFLWPVCALEKNDKGCHVACTNYHETHPRVGGGPSTLNCDEIYGEGFTNFSNKFVHDQLGAPENIMGAATDYEISSLSKNKYYDSCIASTQPVRGDLNRLSQPVCRPYALPGQEGRIDFQCSITADGKTREAHKCWADIPKSELEEADANPRYFEEKYGDKILECLFKNFALTLIAFGGGGHPDSSMAYFTDGPQKGCFAPVSSAAPNMTVTKTYICCTRKEPSGACFASCAGYPAYAPKQ